MCVFYLYCRFVEPSFALLLAIFQCHRRSRHASLTGGGGGVGLDHLARLQGLQHFLTPLGNVLVQVVDGHTVGIVAALDRVLRGHAVFEATAATI